MNNERIVCIGTNSMIYHKPGCKYCNNMKYENMMHLSKNDARKAGYRSCRYCNGMNYHYHTEQSSIAYYRNNKNMQFNYIDGILYVKSEIGCWKLVYIRKEERIALFHRNDSKYEVNFDKPQYESYHRQEDKPYSNSISGYLNYIYEHDKYKAAIKRGETVTKFSSKKYEKREAKAQRKRQISRVDYLFRVLERQNEGYKALSMC